MSAPSRLQMASWSALERFVQQRYKVPDFVNGATNAHSRLRLFGQPEDKVRVTLYRDNHAWCPYCQKIWLFLEEKKIPYRVRKVTMFCYGQKEAWYKKLVPSGMLPALQIDDAIPVITESDTILAELEAEFGPLNSVSMHSKEAVSYRKLERALFRVWCNWLCRDHRGNKQAIVSSKEDFIQVLSHLDSVLGKNGPFFFGQQLTICDLILTPYIERMSASLYYYKNGFCIRDRTKFPNVTKWFEAMERRETYRGTKSSFHTHAHDLPPQMGGCYFDEKSATAVGAAAVVDFETSRRRSASDDPDQILSVSERHAQETSHIIIPSSSVESEGAALEAASRVLRFQKILREINPYGETATDQALRLALTEILNVQDIESSESSIVDPRSVALAARYVHDRINVPRDMSLGADRRLRSGLEKVIVEMAALCGETMGNLEKDVIPIPLEHRRDQEPTSFRN